jgi:hypothetical protein
MAESRHQPIWQAYETRSLQTGGCRSYGSSFGSSNCQAAAEHCTIRRFQIAALSTDRLAASTAFQLNLQTVTGELAMQELAMQE